MPDGGVGPSVCSRVRVQATPSYRASLQGRPSGLGVDPQRATPCKAVPPPPPAGGRLGRLLARLADRRGGRAPPHGRTQEGGGGCECSTLVPGRRRVSASPRAAGAGELASRSAPPTSSELQCNEQIKPRCEPRPRPPRRATPPLRPAFPSCPAADRAYCKPSSVAQASGMCRHGSSTGTAGEGIA